jgi:hypothetical protein
VHHKPGSEYKQKEFKSTLIAVGPTSTHTLHSDTNTDIPAHTQNHRTSTEKLSVIIIPLLKHEWAGTATRYGSDGSGIDSGEERDFQTPLSPGLGPTQPPVQWAQGIFPWGKAAGAWRLPSTLIYSRG